MCVCTHAHAHTCIYAHADVHATCLEVKGQFQMLIFFFSSVGPRDWTQVIRIAQQIFLSTEPSCWSPNWVSMVICKMLFILFLTTFLLGNDASLNMTNGMTIASSLLILGPSLLPTIVMASLLTAPGTLIMDKRIIKEYNTWRREWSVIANSVLWLSWIITVS